MPLNTLKNWTSRLRNRHFFYLDVLIILLSPYLALLIRFDANLDIVIYLPGLIYTTIVFAIIKFSVFVVFDLYKRYWRTASIDELARLIYIGVNAILIQTFVFIILKSFKDLPFANLPLSLPLIEGAISMILVSSVRFSVRLFERVGEIQSFSTSFGSYVLIIGAGAAGASVVQELQRNNKLNMTPVAFLDDDPEKLKLRIRGIPVIGKVSELPAISKKFNITRVILAIPTVSGKLIREVLEMANKNNIEALTVPAIQEILSGKVNLTKFRKIEVEDLLRRKPIKTDYFEVNNFLSNKVVLLTGGGGSIGSELCRQILKINPSKLIVLGHGENSIFEIEEELRYIKKNSAERKIINTNIISRIADIKDKERIGIIFNQFKPDIIFHAAAHKHVPLMEHNPSEVISNNLLGTKNLVEAAIENNVKNFILISSDKAVNSTNLMGVSKRVAEMTVLNAAKQYGVNFKAVRFGNVLGSRGSVIRTFRKQLERGGPLTITHPDIKRYFMTIPEAVQLVLQASVLGKGGEIFVLDMGEPVKIIDLAKDVIRLAGLEEGVDVDIEVTGLRPGEKMFEELFGDGEEYVRTEHEKIMFAKNSSEFIPADLEDRLNYLIQNCNRLSKEEIISQFRSITPEFNHQIV